MNTTTNTQELINNLLDERIECALRAQLGEERWYQLDQEERTILSTAYTEKIINHQCVRASSTLHPADITHRLQHLVQEGYLTSHGLGRGTTYTLSKKQIVLEANMDSSMANMDSSGANMDSSGANMDSSGANMDSSVTNMDSLSSNMGTSPANIGTSESGKPSKIPFQQTRLLILEYCCEWRSLDDISRYMNRTKRYLRNLIIPQLKSELQKRFPLDNHPNQMYRRRDVQESDSE